MAHSFDWQFGHWASLLADARQEIVGRGTPGHNEEMPRRLFDLFQARGTQAGQRAFGRDNQHQPLAEVQEFGEVRIVKRPANQTQLHTVIIQHLDDLVAVAGVHKKVHVWMRIVKLYNCFGQKTTGQRLQGSNGDAPALALLAQTRGLDAFIQHLQRSLHICQEALAAIGQCEFAPAAYKERPADLLFQSLDTRADRRLCNIQLARGPAETTLTRNAVEGQQLIDIHVTPCIIENFDIYYSQYRLDLWYHTSYTTVQMHTIHQEGYLDRMGFLKALRLPHIALLWTSQVLSAMGDYFYTIAVMWIAVKTSGSDAGLVAGAEAVATLVFGLLGGVYADRWNRRITMVSVDLVRAAAVLLLPVLALAGRLQFWHLIGVAVVIGSLGALFDPALQASLPALTGDTRTLQATNGLMDITRRLARTLGPSMAGLLIAFLPLAHFFTLDAVSFAISALAVLALGSRFAWKPVRGEDRERTRGIKGLVQEAVEGMRLVRAHRPLFWSLIAVSISNFVWSIAFVVGVPLLVARGLGNSVGAYGLIVGAYGVGNVLSNLVIGSLSIKRRVPLIFLGKGILGIGFFLLATSSSVPMALFASALAAVGGPMGDIMTLTMLQTDLPSDQIGKAYSLRMILENMGSSLGYLVAVPFFGLVSVPLGIALSALLLLVVSALGLLRFGLQEPKVPALAADRRG